MGVFFRWKKWRFLNFALKYECKKIGHFDRLVPNADDPADMLFLNVKKTRFPLCNWISFWESRGCCEVKNIKKMWIYISYWKCEFHPININERRCIPAILLWNTKMSKNQIIFKTENYAICPISISSKHFLPRKHFEKLKYFSKLKIRQFYPINIYGLIDLWCPQIISYRGNALKNWVKSNVNLKILGKYRVKTKEIL